VVFIMLRFAALFLLTLRASTADYDLLIRNARVIDGAGNPWFRADVAVKDGRIAAIGRLADRSAARTIDARERVVAPGFIDAHTHVEGGIERNPRGDNFLLDGVTTVITGNCGGSELNLAQWFDKLGKLGLGINVASLVGHNTVRREVMGTANRLATPEEIARMQSLVDLAGFRGKSLAVGRSLPHVSRPLRGMVRFGFVRKSAGFCRAPMKIRAYCVRPARC
jgi:N-acyl-D-amino-acid deacylase